MLDKNYAADILTAALAGGGDFAEIFVENSELSRITMINGVVEKSLWGVNYGCGLRIFRGLSSVYAYTNDASKLLTLAEEAAQTAIAPTKEIRFAKMSHKNAHPIITLPASGAKKAVVDKLRQAASAATSTDACITQTSGGFRGHTQDVLIVNSDGLWAEDRRVWMRLMIESVASSGNEKQTSFLGPGAHQGFEFIENLDIEKLGRETAQSAATMLRADLCPSGRMPVVIGNGFGGVLFHEACGHSLEAASVANQTSVFSNSLGQPIASECVTAIDDGTMPGEWGSMNIDDEGSETRRTVLIENGVLKSFLIDRLNGLKMGMPSTGSGRRESFQYAPVSRMTNTYIAAGKDKNIIADTEYGLYAKKMGGGSVNPATGDFNFAVLEGYLIRNGQITEPVRGATLIGKGSEVLMNIDRVSDDLGLGQGMCGASSGSVPVNVGQPMIRVKEMTVGGRK